jgi:hypothetical protein
MISVKTARTHLTRHLAKGFWNAASANIGWFACVLGAAWDRQWVGLIVVPILFVIHSTAVERHKIPIIILLALAAMIIGLFTDTALIMLGTVEPNRSVMPHPLLPLWDLMIWANFSLTLNTSLGFLQKKPFVSAVLGAVCAPGTYYGAGRLGALHFSEPVFVNLLWIGFVWFFAMPCLSLTAMYVHRHRNKISA